MNATRRMTWLVLAGLWVSALSAGAIQVRYERHQIRGSRNSWKVYSGSALLWSYPYRLKIVVPSNTASMTIETGYDTHGGTGDSDLYLGYGFVPTTARYTYRRTTASHREKIAIRRPRKGNWYLRLRGVRNYQTCLRVVFNFTPPGGARNWQKDMLAQVNYWRGVHGRRTLATDSRLQRTAQAYATDMAVKKYYGGRAHLGTAAVGLTSLERFTRSGYPSGYETAGGAENIAWGFTSVSIVMNEWMNSPRSRTAILNSRMQHAGFGKAYGADAYRTRWVQMFGYRR